MLRHAESLDTFGCKGNRLWHLPIYTSKPFSTGAVGSSRLSTR